MASTFRRCRCVLVHIERKAAGAGHGTTTAICHAHAPGLSRVLRWSPLLVPRAVGVIPGSLCESIMAHVHVSRYICDLAQKDPDGPAEVRALEGPRERGTSGHGAAHCALRLYHGCQRRARSGPAKRAGEAGSTRWTSKRFTPPNTSRHGRARAPSGAHGAGATL